MNDTSLKAKVRNIAKAKKLPAQLVLQNYLFERFLLRLSMTEYKDKFVVKGGTLISAIVGLENRATMDLDTTLKNMTLTPNNIGKAMEVICKVEQEDGIIFEYKGMEPIRDDDIYGGYRVMFIAHFGKIEAPMSMDVSTGDIITPAAELRSFSMMFEDGMFSVWTYNIETILGEKVETILSRGVYSTRPRDFYDVYALTSVSAYDWNIFREALTATARHRGSLEKISNTEEVLESISKSEDLKRLWNNYQKQFIYASDIDYDNIMKVLHKLLDNVQW